MSQNVDVILHRTRNRIADFMLLVMVIGGFPALIASLLRETKQPFWVIETIQLLVFVAVVASLVLRRRLETRTKSHVIVGAMTVLSLLYIIMFSPASGMALMIVSTVTVAIFHPLVTTFRYALFCFLTITGIGIIRVYDLDGFLIDDAGMVAHTLPVWIATLFGYAWMSSAVVVGVIWMRQALLQMSVDQLLSKRELVSGKKFLEEIRVSAGEVANYFSSLERVEDVSFRPSLQRFAELLNCERASLWLQNDDGDVACFGLYDANNPDASHEGLVLRRKDLPRYFAALETGQAIDAENAKEDPRTSEFTENYLIPLNIGAMLDVSLMSVAGRMGVVCFETVGRTRVWRSDEVVFAHMAGGLLAAAAGIKSIMEADEALNFSRRRFEAVANYTYDWESWVSSDGRLVWVNPAVERILGYSVSECMTLENYPLPFVAPEDQARVRHYLDEGLSGLSGSDREFTAIHKNGNRVSIGMSWQQIADSDGTNLGVRISCRDVTERVRYRRDLEYAKTDLEANQRRLRAHFNNAKIGVFYWTPDRTIIEVNDTACQLFGFSAEEFVGKKLELIVPPSERARLGTLINEIMETRTSVNNRFENVTRSGKRLVCEWYESPIFDTNGQLDCIASFALDVTDRQRYQETLESIYRGVRYQVGEDFFDNLTKVMCEALGMHYCHVGSIENGRVKPVAHYSHDKSRGGLEFEVKGSAAEMVVDNGIFVCPDNFKEVTSGVRRVTDLKIRGYVGAALKDSEGNPIGILATVSEQPIADPELARSIVEVFAARASAELQRLQAERKREKLEQQLRHSQRMETIGVLAGGIAHDFNNILQPISGYAELLYTDLPEDSPLREDVMEIRQGADRARDLVKQILSFSRNSETERSPIDVASMIKGTVRFARGSIPSTVSLVSNLAPDTMSILGNATQLDQCLMNLITNAYHAVGEEGEIKIEAAPFELTDDSAEMHPLLTPGPYIRISVIDNGTGMDADTAKKIFDPFFTTKEPGKGTGLGLSTVHGIIAGHKGEITVYSRLGQGTRFSILLPEYDREEEGEERVSRGLVSNASGHLAVVDDEEKNLKLCSRMLERIGYTVETFTNGADAIEAIKAPGAKFDGLLTDQTMPNMTGVKLVELLRQSGHDIPVVVMTGYAADDIVAAYKDLGVETILAKPVDVVELHDALATACKGATEHAPSSEKPTPDASSTDAVAQETALPGEPLP
ncbi:PAS domain S-box protein [Thalassospira povalilytica]|uniref:PAS domain S-box protein n=1 Tax=Thalassospira povalilytica TaxID=732237 RepID=UPI001D17DE99|nr:PAS domain S-box protein [Thalassospira povalilytica]MCC4242230.1 PAS domain S-box protein [Thalassospira povalilytica]